MQGDPTSAGKVTHGPRLGPATHATAPSGADWFQHKAPHWGLWLPTGAGSRPVHQCRGELSAHFHLTPHSSSGTHLPQRPSKHLVPRLPPSPSPVTRGRDRSERRQRRLRQDVGKEKTTPAMSKASARASPELRVLVPSSPYLKTFVAPAWRWARSGGVWILSAASALLPVTRWSNDPAHVGPGKGIWVRSPEGCPRQGHGHHGRACCEGRGARLGPCSPPEAWGEQREGWGRGQMGLLGEFLELAHATPFIRRCNG